jgi:hypothetical protein
MAMLIIVSTLVGAVLGMRFRVFILVPAIVVGCLAAICGHVAFRVGLGATFAAVALIAVGLQIGYLGGIATRFVIAATRVARRPKSWAPSVARRILNLTVDRIIPSGSSRIEYESAGRTGRDG